MTEIDHDEEHCPTYDQASDKKNEINSDIQHSYNNTDSFNINSHNDTTNNTKHTNSHNMTSDNTRHINSHNTINLIFQITCTSIDAQSISTLLSEILIKNSQLIDFGKLNITINSNNT